jgi:UDP-N-acetylglucosamine 2-epimerase (non-hydrolysing)
MKIAVVLGTRPEAIKLAPVVLALKRESEIVCLVWATAQHRGMLDQVLEIFGIAPDLDLNLMTPDQSLSALTARCLEELDRCIDQERPELILVQGDTTTVLCASLAAFYRKIPVAHLEAGLRTGDMHAPWPEEANRVLTSRLAAVHFAPTESARRNLLREGVQAADIVVTGNTVVDALFAALQKAEKEDFCIPGLPTFLQPAAHRVGDLPRIVLITGHRRESFGDGFENICHGIAVLANQFPDVQFVYPVHLNPNVRDPVMRILCGSNGRNGSPPEFKNGDSTQRSGPRLAAAAGNIHLIDPLSYLPFIWLMNRCTLILTDSGGVQEEAPSLGKPVLVMRDTTERPEAVAAGTARLVGSDRERIVREVSRLLTDAAAYERMSRSHNPYGDGHAAQRVVIACRKYLERRRRRAQVARGSGSVSVGSCTAGSAAHPRPL